MMNSPDSPTSFHTANRSPRSSISDDSVNSPNAVPSRSRRYRPAIQLSQDIRKHCWIYFDEQLYISALTLLSDLVTSGASHPDGLERPAFAPAPFYIELVSCLLIHPRHTTQAPPNERLEIASRSIAFLRNLLAILGPVNANLGEAFSLTNVTYHRNTRRSRNAVDVEVGSGGSESEDETERMRGIIANQGRTRRCAKDFWHMVGWAFNCSVNHPRRWKYWKVWLDYMLDVLDADWKERESEDMDAESFESQSKANLDIECEYKSLRKSILVQYLSDVTGRSTAMKRVVRSVFADGGSESLRDFPEVFQNETKELKSQTGQKRKRDGLVERQYGHYDDEEIDDAAFDAPQLTDGLPEPSHATDNEGDPWLGGTESIILRQRVLTLLSRVAAFLPESFINCRDLYEAIYTCFRPLPLQAFSLLISPSNSSHYPTAVFVSLSQLFLCRLLPTTTPPPQSITHRENDDISQDILEKCFLPFSANTSSTEDNAKVSLLVESLFRLFLKSCRVYHTPNLDAAIETGILARETKSKGVKKRREAGARSNDEENSRMWLKASGERLRSLLSWVEERNYSDED